MGAVPWPPKPCIADPDPDMTILCLQAVRYTWRDLPDNASHPHSRQCTDCSALDLDDKLADFGSRHWPCMPDQLHLGLLQRN